MPKKNYVLIQKKEKLMKILKLTKKTTISKCPKCGTEFIHYKIYYRKYCSKKCLWKTTSERMKIFSYHTPAWRRHMSKIMSSDRHPMLGKHHTLETRLKQSQSCLGINKGENNGNWKGGKGTLREKIAASSYYKWWRHSIFQRDNYTCCECHKIGRRLHVHHIKSMKKIIEEYQLINIEDAYQCKELWNIKNGITLCDKCHYLKHPNINVLKNTPKYPYKTIKDYYAFKRF